MNPIENNRLIKLAGIENGSWLTMTIEICWARYERIRLAPRPSTSLNEYGSVGSFFNFDPLG